MRRAERHRRLAGVVAEELDHVGRLVESRARRELLDGELGMDQEALVFEDNTLVDHLLRTLAGVVAEQLAEPARRDTSCPRVVRDRAGSGVVAFEDGKKPLQRIGQRRYRTPV